MEAVKNWDEVRDVLAEVVGGWHANVAAIREGAPISRQKLAKKVGVGAYYCSYYGDRIYGTIAVKKTENGYEVLPYPFSWSDASGGSGEGDEVDTEKVAEQADLAIRFHICEFENVYKATVMKVE